MITLLFAFLHFVLYASDPSWKCEITHRDPNVAGTYYLYCAQMSPDGVEMIDVGATSSPTREGREAGEGVEATVKLKEAIS